ncbi:MAG: hypothetical protein HY700_01965 [Gemmatimonadetes bacterium]|nr:hypothetical protein [Gemmatimonadota bacterium]
MPEEIRPRVGFCADTCHLYSAGYDLVREWDAVWREPRFAGVLKIIETPRKTIR